MEKRKSIKNRVFAVMISLAMVITLTPAALMMQTDTANAKTKPANPTVSEDIVTWDCVYFGHYPQSNAGKGKYSSDKIKWRVLSVDGDEALLLADKLIDSGIPYNEGDYAESVTWEECTMRSWLNGSKKSSFINKAFSSDEQDAIPSKTIKNSNPETGTTGGNDTTDKVFLLSIEEATNPSYGFSSSSEDESKTRRAKTTDYAKNARNTQDWWLRSPGGDTDFASLVNGPGRVDTLGYPVNGDDDGDDCCCALRPALYLNLNSDCWSYAGKVKCLYSINPEYTFIDTVKAGKKSFTVKWEKQSAKVKDSHITGYQIQYSKSSKFAKGNKTVKVKGYKKTSKKITKLAAKTKYYVRVRTYIKIDEKNYYSDWSYSRSLKTK